MQLVNKLNLSWVRKLQIIRQTEAAECGVACLAMIAGWHGYKIDLPSLRAVFNVSKRGMTLSKLNKYAETLHLAGRALRVDLDELKNVALPCILHWDMNHFVVLNKIRGDRLEIHDPARGAVMLSFAELGKRFTGVLLELRPTHDFQARDDRKKIKLWDLVGQTDGLKKALVKIFAFAVTLELIALLGPLLTQVVIDEVLTSKDVNLLTLILICMLLLAAVQAIIDFVRQWATITMSVNFNLQWSTNVFHHLLRLPVDWFEKRHLGDVSAKFDAVGVIQRSLTTSVLQALIDIVLVCGTLLMMMVYSLKLSCIAIFAAIFYAILKWCWFSSLRQASEGSWVAGTKESSHFLETIRGIASLRVNSALKSRTSGWGNLNIERRNAQLHESKLAMVFGFSNKIISSLVSVAVLWFGASAVINGNFSVGMLVAYISFQSGFTKSISSVVDKVFEYKMLTVYNERLADIVLTPKEILKTDFYIEDLIENASRSAAEQVCAVELVDVGFSYGDGERKILQNVNLKIYPGEIVALTGPSGCGKTTLIKLILGLYRPGSGRVDVFGRDVASRNTEVVLSSIGSVLQNDELFSGSILDNIAFFSNEIDMEKAISCAQLAELHDEIEILPMGYQTLIGGIGGALSGGQRQRLLLARALYRDPELLILDEATSHLDVGNEEKVSAMLRARGVTVIFIAHRPETISSADRVIEMRDGKISAHGARACAGLAS